MKLPTLPRALHQAGRRIRVRVVKGRTARIPIQRARFRLPGRGVRKRDQW